MVPPDERLHADDPAVDTSTFGWRWTSSSPSLEPPRSSSMAAAVAGAAVRVGDVRTRHSRPAFARTWRRQRAQQLLTVAPARCGGDADARAHLQPDALDVNACQLAQPLARSSASSLRRSPTSTANSSPPSRATVSWAGARAAAGGGSTQQLVAAWWPRLSLTSLKRSRSSSSRAAGRPGPWPSGEHPSRLLQQGPAVGQAGELVGAGLLLDLVERADLAEGDGRAGQRGEHATDRQPGSDDRQPRRPIPRRGRPGWRCCRRAGMAGTRQPMRDPPSSPSPRRGRTATRAPCAAMPGQTGSRPAR